MMVGKQSPVREEHHHPLKNSHGRKRGSGVGGGVRGRTSMEREGQGWVGLEVGLTFVIGIGRAKHNGDIGAILVAS